MYTCFLGGETDVGAGGSNSLILAAPPSTDKLSRPPEKDVTFVFVRQSCLVFLLICVEFVLARSVLSTPQNDVSPFEGA